MELKKLLFLTLFFIAFTSSIVGQKLVSGVVTDADVTLLIGVNTVLKGTSTGTITDFDGC